MTSEPSDPSISALFPSGSGLEEIQTASKRRVADDERSSRKSKLWSSVAHRLNTLVGKAAPSQARKTRRASVFEPSPAQNLVKEAAPLSEAADGARGEGRLSKGQVPHKDLFARSASKRHPGPGIMSLGQQMRDVAMASDLDSIIQGRSHQDEEL